MKKFLSFICCFLFMLLLISGCSCNKDEDDNKANLGFGDMNATTYRELNSLAAFESKVKNGDSFVLFIYMNGCGHCKNFKPILDHVIDERNLIVYGIEISHVYGYKGLESIKGTPYMVVYKDGEVLAIAEDNKYYKNYEGLESFFDEYTYKPIAYYITLDQLREKKANNENFIVYFSRSGCYDCNYLNEHYMKDLFNTYHAEKTFYVLECDAEGIRYYDGQYDAGKWQAIKDEFGLSEAGSATFGYGSGVVPSFQYYNNGVLTDMAVYANDGYTEVTNSDGSTSITITSSYYSDNPHIGDTMLYIDYQDTVADYFNGKINAFLSQYLRFVD